MKESRKRSPVVAVAVAGLLVAVLVAAACSSTRLVSVWRAPDSGPYVLAGQKVATLVMTKHEGRRRAAEDLLARRITQGGGRGVASWTLIPQRDVRNESRAREALRAAGVDAVVSLAVVDRERETTYTHGYWTAYPRYRGFWGWYGWGWGTVYEPPRRHTNQIVSVETLVYSLKTDKLVWAATSKTENPDGAEELYESVADAVVDEMKESGLLR